MQRLYLVYVLTKNFTEQLRNEYQNKYLYNMPHFNRFTKILGIKLENFREQRLSVKHSCSSFIKFRFEFIEEATENNEKLYDIGAMKRSRCFQTTTEAR